MQKILFIFIFLNISIIASDQVFKIKIRYLHACLTSEEREIRQLIALNETEDRQAFFTAEQQIKQERFKAAVHIDPNISKNSLTEEDRLVKYFVLLSQLFCKKMNNDKTPLSAYECLSIDEKKIEQIKIFYYQTPNQKQKFQTFMNEYCLYQENFIGVMYHDTLLFFIDSFLKRNN